MGTENGNLRVSESRSKVYFDYAEREQIQDRKAGLKRKTITAPALLFNFIIHKLIYSKNENL